MKTWCKMLTKVAMRTYSVYLVVELLVLVSCSAIPKPGEENHKDSKDRITDRALSDAAHAVDEEHNAEYDHARTFDGLSPEESKERLGIIVDKIDKDKDGFITESELKEWIEYVNRRYEIIDAAREWAAFKLTGDTLTWETYEKKTFGTLDENDEAAEGFESTKKLKARDKRRWNAADANGDNMLDKQEFVYFKHPEYGAHMEDVVVEETLEEFDKDKDGFISFEEYISDVYDDQDEEALQEERSTFSNYRDSNHDGKIDKEEIRNWLSSMDYDHDAETKHLIHEADDDKDGKLSKKEILEHHEEFASSQVTDFSEALHNPDTF